MAHIYKKIKKGREYYYIRETQRVENRPATINQVYLGSLDKLEAIWAGEDPKAREGYSPKEFGSLFVINELDRAINLAELVDEVLPAKRRSKGPTLGGLLFYAVLNRAIAPTSKRQLAGWYETTDIQRIRPLRLTSLNSQNFWNYWHRLGETSLEIITGRFFQRVQAVLPASDDYLLRWNPSYYSLPSFPEMTQSQGSALIIQRNTGVPVYHHQGPPDLTPAAFLDRHLKGLLDKVQAMEAKVRSLTWIFPPGLASEKVIQRIDAQEGLHFVAPFPSHLAPELAGINLESLQLMPEDGRWRPIRGGTAEEPRRFYEIKLPVWGRTRKVLLIFDPGAYRQKFQELKELGKKLKWKLRRYPSGQSQKDEPGALEGRYQELCRELNLEPELFRLEIRREKGVAVPSLEVDEPKIAAQAQESAKTLLITDQEDWLPEELLQAYQGGPILAPEGTAAPSLGLPALMPQYHWTPSKVRINTFVSLVALTYLALLGLRLKSGGLKISPQEAIQEMRGLKSAIFWLPQEEKFKRLLKAPTPGQQAIMQALGFTVREGAVIPRVAA